MTAPASRIAGSTAFPTKEDLVAAVFSDRMDADADADADVLTTTFPTSKALEQRRNEADRAMLRLIDRAKAAGRLREDFDPSDLMLTHMANAGVNATGDAAPDAWRRVVASFIQSFEAPARGSLPASPEVRTVSPEPGTRGPCHPRITEGTVAQGSPIGRQAARGSRAACVAERA
ncbi:hypothetical protein PO587_27635 [Streptomyces gilvifuscus]|uniref:TetR family transcriptional regulator n=1 Tax=Streptomyces gilvifuscus TaxID=1550617 RepID=A0ABT5G0B1_9ACTN|nr:hypothetical protein [Streptomyces gilvifuscus]MDC2958218.1 hypothetical protein [Streptomyces gilvifuscus]